MKRLGLTLALGLSSIAPVAAETYHCPAGQMYRVKLDTCVSRDAFYAALARFGYRPKTMPAPKPVVAATRCPVLTVQQVTSPPLTPALASLPPVPPPETAPEPAPEIPLPYAATGPASLNPLAWQPQSLWQSPLYVVN